jgi:hypothetical protein
MVAMFFFAINLAAKMSASWKHWRESVNEEWACKTEVVWRFKGTIQEIGDERLPQLAELTTHRFAKLTCNVFSFQLCLPQRDTVSNISMNSHLLFILQ